MYKSVKPGCRTSVVRHVCSWSAAAGVCHHLRRLSARSSSHDDRDVSQSRHSIARKRSVTSAYWAAPRGGASFDARIFTALEPTCNKRAVVDIGSTSTLSISEVKKTEIGSRMPDLPDHQTTLEVGCKLPGGSMDRQLECVLLPSLSLICQRPSN